MVGHALLSSTSCSPLRCTTPSSDFEPLIIDTREVRQLRQDEWSVKSSLCCEKMTADMSKQDQLFMEAHSEERETYLSGSMIPMVTSAHGADVLLLYYVLLTTTLTCPAVPSIHSHKTTTVRHQPNEEVIKDTRHRVGLHGEVAALKACEL